MLATCMYSVHHLLFKYQAILIIIIGKRFLVNRFILVSYKSSMESNTCAPFNWNRVFNSVHRTRLVKPVYLSNSQQTVISICQIVCMAWSKWNVYNFHLLFHFNEFVFCFHTLKIRISSLLRQFHWLNTRVCPP